MAVLYSEIQATYKMDLPSRLRTLTGTKTEGGDGCVGPTCKGGGIVEQYSIGLFGFGLLNEDISDSKLLTKINDYNHINDDNTT